MLLMSIHYGYLHIYLVIAVLIAGTRADYDCKHGSSTSITVNHEPEIITSPAFPRRYPNSHRCNVSISAEENDHVLHVEVVHMQLDNWNSTCLDYIIAYDGDGSEANVLHRWCGTDHQIVSTSGTNIFLEFSSDESLSDVGFAVSVWSAPQTNESCGRDTECYMRVGSQPLHLYSPCFDLSKGELSNVSRKGGVQCVYKLESVQPSDVITVTIPVWSSLANLYTLEIYDGPDTSSPVLLHWSHSNQPFYDLTSSGNDLTLVLRAHWVDMSEVANEITTFRAISTTLPRSCDDYVVSREVISLPSLLTYPTTWNSSGHPCPLKIISRDFRKTLRIDLTTSSNEEDTADIINVTEGSMTGIMAFVTKTGNRTTYRSAGPVVYIHVHINSSLSEGQTVRLRILAQDSIHNGQVIVRTAINSSVSTDLSLEHLPCNAYIVHSIIADCDHNVVQLEMTSVHHDPDVTGCEDIMVEFFDGNHSDEKPLKRWCPGNDVSLTVRGTQRHLSFIIHTGEADARLSLTGRYFSLKEGSMCGSGYTDVPASAKELRFITSPNYPGNYSVNNDCVWRIAAPRINYVIVAEVTWSDLPNDCTDLVYVVYGINPSDRTVGRICGQDRMSFRSRGPTLLLHFVSNSHVNRRGFNISYTTEHVTGGQRTEGGPPVGVIAGACITLFVVGGIIYVVVHVNRKRHKRVKREREEY